MNQDSLIVALTLTLLLVQSRHKNPLSGDNLVLMSSTRKSLLIGADWYHVVESISSRGGITSLNYINYEETIL